MDPDGVPTGAYDRVVRIVSWVFILATSTIVAITGLWPDTQPAIFALLAIAGLFVLLVHDLLPPSSLGSAKFIVEGSVAITFATLLVLLTGGQDSPFFFTFPLIVGGAALVVSPRVTFALAAVASLAYVFAIASPGSAPLLPVVIAKVGINLTALVLLAYVATVIAVRAAAVARRGDPALDHRPADGALQSDVLLRCGRSGDRPECPLQSRVLRADDGPR